MAKNPLTASERRGIIAIAIVAMLITGSGLWLARCGRPEVTVTPEEVEVLLDGTSQIDTLSKKANIKPKKKKVDKESKKKNGKELKTYRKRSLLDEPVSSD